MAESTERTLELEDRVRKLETVVADDDAVADRVIAKLTAIAAERNTGSDRMLVMATPADVPPPPQGAVLHPPPADPGERKWFLHQIAAELRIVATMYFDPRYRISRTVQFALPGIMFLLVFNYFFFSAWVTIPFLSPVLERLLVVVLTLVGYKLMVRELARYREVLDYLARYGR